MIQDAISTLLTPAYLIPVGLCLCLMVIVLAILICLRPGQPAARSRVEPRVRPVPPSPEPDWDLAYRKAWIAVEIRRKREESLSKRTH